MHQFPNLPLNFFIQVILHQKFHCWNQLYCFFLVFFHYFFLYLQSFHPDGSVETDVQRSSSLASSASFPAEKQTKKKKIRPPYLILHEMPCFEALLSCLFISDLHCLYDGGNLSGKPRLLQKKYGFKLCLQ